MAKAILGFEIGDYRLKIAVTAAGTVEQVVTEEVPENLVREGVIVSWEAMADFIRDTMKKYKLGGKNAAVVLPENTTYMRRITLPLMTEAQLKVNLPYEFRDFITEDKDKYYYDYAVIPTPAGIEEGTDNPELSLLAAAISKDTIDRYRTMFRRSGLKLAVAAPEAMAYQNLIRKHLEETGEKEQKDYMILDLGHEVIRLQIFTDGYYEMSRNMDVGLSAMTRVLADKLDVDRHIAEVHKQNNQDQIWECEECKELYTEIAVGIMRVVNFFTFNHPDNTLETVYYCGGGAKITPLIEEIGNVLELKLEGIEALFTQSNDRQDALRTAPAAIGITWN